MVMRTYAPEIPYADAKELSIGLNCKPPHRKSLLDMENNLASPSIRLRLKNFFLIISYL